METMQDPTERIQLQLKISKIYLFLALFVLMMNLFIILYVSLNYLYKISLIGFNIIYLFYILARYCWFILPTSIQTIEYNSDEWILGSKNTIHYARLCLDSTVTRFVCLLRFKIRTQKRFSWKRVKSCVIWRDSVRNDEEYRRLLMLLKTSRW